MRYISAAIIFLLTLAGALAVVGLHFAPPLSHRVEPPLGPSALEESGGVVGVVSPGMSPPQQPQVPDTRGLDPLSQVSVAPSVPHKTLAQPISEPSESTAPPSRAIGPRHQEARRPAGPEETGTSNEGATGAFSSGVSQDSDAIRAPVITPPVLQTLASLSYPPGAFRIVVDRTAPAAGFKVQAAEGRVVLKVLVHADGTVGQLEIAISSGNAILDGAAVRAASTWRFTPATRDGLPIDAWAIVPVRFVIP